MKGIEDGLAGTGYAVHRDRPLERQRRGRARVPAMARRTDAGRRHHPHRPLSTPADAEFARHQPIVVTGRDLDATRCALALDQEAGGLSGDAATCSAWPSPHRSSPARPPTDAIERRRLRARAARGRAAACARAGGAGDFMESGGLLAMNRLLDGPSRSRRCSPPTTRWPSAPNGDVPARRARSRRRRIVGVDDLPGARPTRRR